MFREFLGTLHDDIREMLEEIAPFKSEFTHNLVTIMNEDDLKQSGYYSPKSILEVEKDSKK